MRESSGKNASVPNTSILKEKGGQEARGHLHISCQPIDHAFPWEGGGGESVLSVNGVGLL